MMKYEPTVSSRFIVYLSDYLVEVGQSNIPLFDDPQLSYRAEEEVDPPVALSLIAEYFEKAQSQTGDAFLGMHIAQRHHYEFPGVIILTMLSSATVLDGINTLCRYDKYVDSAIETTFVQREKISEFSIGLLNPKNAKVNQLSEFLSCFFVDILNKATRGSVPVTEVWFSHNRTGDKKPLEDFFGARVLFNQAHDLIFFKSSYLRKPFLSSSPVLQEIMTNALNTYYTSKYNKNLFLDSICREIIRQTEKNATPTLKSVAESLTISARTLTRNISEEGYNFQEVKNLAREERAKYFLSSTVLSLAEIGYKLGFSQLSAFSRAFRSWTGTNPQSYREEVKNSQKS